MAVPIVGPTGNSEVATSTPKIVAPPGWDRVKRDEFDILAQRLTDLEHSLDTRSTGAVGRQAPTKMDMQAERDRTDAKIEAAEARTETKFALTNAKLDALMLEVQGSRADGKTTRTVITTTMVGSVLALAALMYALVSYGAAQFYNGTTIYDHLHPAAVSQDVHSK